MILLPKNKLTILLISTNSPDPVNLIVFTHAMDEITKSASELVRTGAVDQGSFEEMVNPTTQIISYPKLPSKTQT